MLPYHRPSAGKLLHKHSVEEGCGGCFVTLTQLRTAWEESQLRNPLD